MATKLIPLFMLMISMQHTFAQTETMYCDTLRKELNEAIESHDLWDIEYRYYKLLNACGVTEFEMEAVEQCFDMSHWSIAWRPDRSYQVTGMPETSIHWTDYYAVFNISGLMDDHPIKMEHNSFADFLEAVGVKREQLLREPVSIENYKVILIKLHDKQLVLRAADLEQLLVIHSDDEALGYAGAGMFIANYGDNRCEVYRVVNADTHPEMEKLISQPGQAISFPFSDHRNLVYVVDHSRENGRYSLYDHDGQAVFLQHDFIELGPTSRTIIAQKEGRYKLVDYELNTILDDAEYIFEVWKQGTPYYLYDAQDGKRHLYDKAGNIILSGKDYKTISINRTPYAIVRKDKEYGVIDFVTEAVWVPYQKERIHQLCPGFMTSFKDGVWTVFDEKHRQTASIKAHSLSIVADRGKVVLKASNEHGKEGAYDLFGNELLPQIYDAIEFKDLEGKLLVTSGQTQFKTDLNGNKLEN